MKSSNSSTSERPHRLSARAAAAEIAAGRLSCEGLTRDCLERIAERESTVHAWAFLDPEAALRNAREIDAGPRPGLLHGIPIGIKDVIDSHGMPTGCGSPIYQGVHPVGDAGSVAMCRGAGALVLGKTVTAEFATRVPGKTTNPLNPAHTPGGSSSGSAASVADCMVPLALGTQTSGSIIRPASYCGIVGFKPSFGLINRYGVKQVSDSIDTLGTFSRDVADGAFLVAAVTGRSEFNEIEYSRPTRVGICWAGEFAHASPESRAAIHRVADAMRALGVEIVDVVLPSQFEGLHDAHRNIEYFEIARALQHEYRHYRHRLSPVLVSRIEEGMNCSSRAYEGSLQLTHECKALIDHVYTDVDLLMTPSAPGEAPKGLESAGKPMFNRTWTLLGLPCLSLPTDRGPNGLPVGVQFIGRSRQDVRLLSQCGWLEDHLIKGA